MRRFSAEYLRHTRRGLWADRAALADLDLPGRTRILDVGCGAGALTDVLRQESSARVVGVDADRTLLADVDPPTAVGDATSLPFADDSFDLVVCQALLINLPRPIDAVGEFARVSSDLVSAVEPDNAGVSLESTVPAEGRLARRARSAYIAGVGTDVTLGGRAGGLFGDAGLDDVRTTRHEHVRSVEAPYSRADLVGAGRKASAERLERQRETMLAGDLTPADYDALREDWRAMGRAVVDQMREGEYAREESVPFYVTVGRV